MSRFWSNSKVFIAICILGVFAITPTVSVDPPKSCPAASNMQNVNITEFIGTWYEVARYPAKPTMQCVEVNLTNHTNNGLNINVTMATNPKMLNLNTTMHANITLNAQNTVGYNVTYVSGSVSKPVVTLKLLGTDYHNFAFICGYTNASDPTTAFSAILTRQRTPSAINLTAFEHLASANYENFGTNMSLITQSPRCYTKNGATTTTVPALATLFTLLYAILKFFN